MNAPANLADSVRASVVRIGAPPEGYDASSGPSDEGRRSDRNRRAFWGSGFFVAPGWVLTCAHVVGKGAAPVWRGERAIGITIGDTAGTAVAAGGVGAGDLGSSDESVGADGAGTVLLGELAFGLPLPEDPQAPPAPWPFPDLALVRVPGAEDADCLWLSDRSVLTPADIGLYGWAPSEVRGEQMFFTGLGKATGVVGRPLMLSGDQLTEGCSGGPVLDQRRGTVLGVSKGAGRRPGSGLATPITALRKLCDAGPRGARLLHEVLSAHDRHHLRRYSGFWGHSWYRQHARLGPSGGEPAYGFTVDRRAELYALFAEVDPPTGAGQVLQLANEARNMVLRWPYTLRDHDPRSWREGAGLLYDPRDNSTADEEPSGDLALEAVVLYAAKVTAALTRSGRTRTPRAARALADLREWVERTARTLLNDVIRARVPGVLDGHRPASAARADVLVEIEPDIYGSGRHAWRVALVRPAEKDDLHTGDPATVGGIPEPGTDPAAEDGEREEITVEQSREDAPRSRLEEAVRGALSQALDQCDVDDHLAAVEFVLPRPLFDEPVDAWRARPYDPADPFNPHTLPLGQRRLVVVRDRSRKDHGFTPECRSRAAAVLDGPMEAVPLRGEVPGSGHDAPVPEGGQAAYGRLMAAPPGAVPVYCARTGSGPGARAMAAALGAGHAMALWRHSYSDSHDHDDCAEFHERAAELLRETHSARQLPWHIRALRNRNADLSDDPDGASDVNSTPIDPSSAWARHIVLLYDPPHRTSGDGPLREPPLMPRPPTALRSTP
ncbi:trypsin-like peptidase domain-containing protein [Streptomyces sp. 891-h]|uniref:VMAP-C domain-containing protein n=1 Tax=unclassified Streptomyces TaxID=2593676 RepID=UPI001FA95C8F|nr:trypsin-like peptidase domain-containing protein [Streptomyces sp. 891-h]UNZ17336.1 trypsin-like peptidase domain-containing protein [Streptomyces sp. 891-h]